jgi:hypothetical protein
MEVIEMAGYRNNKFDRIENAITVITFVICGIIAVAGFFGFTFGFEYNILIILLVLPLITFLIVKKLSSIDKKIAEKSIYLAESDDVIREMIHMCDEARDFIYTIGSRTKQPLLEAIEKAIDRREVYYRRLVTKDIPDMTVELINHINKIIEKDNQEIKYIAMRECHSPNILMNESRVMVLLPIPESGKFRGTVIASQEAVGQYSNYFNQVFFDDDALPLTKELLDRAIENRQGSTKYITDKRTVSGS